MPLSCHKNDTKNNTPERNETEVVENRITEDEEQLLDALGLCGESGRFLTVPGTPCMPAPVLSDENSDDTKYSFHSFGAQFAKSGWTRS